VRIHFLSADAYRTSVERRVERRVEHRVVAPGPLV
jgi:hypothetical protein